MSLLPTERSDEVYYLDKVTTPFSGEYVIKYDKYNGIRYNELFDGYSIMAYEFCKATRFQELGSAYSKDTVLKYGIDYSDDEPPTIGECDIYEGNNPSETSFTKHTNMIFARYSNSVDKDTSYLKMQTVYDTSGKIISQHVVDIYDTNLEVPTRVLDQTGSRNTIEEFRYDNWGNIIWQYNSATKAEAYYVYANTNTTVIDHAKSVTSPYSAQNISESIHDARIGELVLNSKDGAVIPAQTWYNYDLTGDLLEKAIRWNDTWLKTGYVYDGFGNITKMTSPSGIETYYEYLDTYQNALLTKVTLNKLTDADGNIQNNIILKELGYNPITFRKSWEKDARGYVTEYQYDTLGRETMTVLPDDNDDLNYRPTAFNGTIDRSGFRSDNPAQTIEYKDGLKTTTVIDPLGNRTDYLYDSFEHLMEIVKYKKTLGIHTAYSRVKVGYDNLGNIASIVSPNGCANPDEAYKYTTKYYYDSLNRVAKIVYPDETRADDDNPYKFYDYENLSNWVTVYDENGNRTLTKKDPMDRVYEQLYAVGAGEGFTVRFGYDALGNKISETDGRGVTTQFVYDNLNHLTKKILPAEKVLNNPDGTEQSKSSTLSYEYDNEGNLIRAVSPLGQAIIHIYDEMNREIKTTTEFTSLNGTKKKVVNKTFYDMAGNKVKVVDPNGKQSEFVYTARGWLKQQKDPADGIISFTYDLVGNKITETDQRGNTPGASTNSYTAWYFYDDLYRVVKAVLPDQTPPSDPNNPGDNPVITFVYDYNGNCIKETKANGQEINYKYNGRNWLLEQNETLNGKIYKTSFEYDKVGNKTVIHDNKENKTRFDYDALNRQIRTWLPKGNTVETFYDANGNKTMTRDGRHYGNDYEYDSLNRMKQVTDGEGNITKFWYDEEGRMTKQESPELIRDGQSIKLVTKFYVDEFGRTKRVKDSLGRVREFDYDLAGNVTYKKDSRGTVSSFEYDDLYRLLRQDLQNGDRNQFLSCEYDIVGNVKKASNGQVELIYNDADGNYITDPFNRIHKVKQVMPDGRSYATQYRYDIMGRMTGIRYPNSADWLTYDYDQMGRMTSIPGFAGNKNNPGFMYDDNSALESIKTDNGIITTYERDDNGRITTINASKTGSTVLSLTYTYDDANNIITRNDNSYVYDKVNRLQIAIIRGYFEDKFTKADMLIGKVDQDYHGEREAEEDITEQTQIKLDYSARSLIFNLKLEAENICRVELVPEIDSHRVPMDQLEIYYRNGVGFTKLERNQWAGTKDDKGRIIIRFTPVLNTSEVKIHCNYDDLDLLQLPVDRSEFYNSPEKLVTVYQKFVHRSETYFYDGLGNRTSEMILLRNQYGYTYTYYPNSNQLKTKEKDDGSEKFEYAYDANGNLISKVVTKEKTVDTWEYSYDLLNQLEQVKKNGQIVSTYIYDPNGFRVEKNGNKGRIDYVPLLNGEVGYRKEFSANKEFSFIYVGGQHLARVNGVIGGADKKFYYQNDHLGTAMAITDEYGNKVVERDFAPFGERLQLEENDGIKPEEDDSGFTGKDWDEDVELYYFNARFYDPEVGRFVSEDSVADDPNLYSYCFNNPLNSVDPTGHWNIPVVSGWNLVSASANALAAIDPKAKELAGTVGMFISIKSGIQNVKALYNKCITGNYTETYERSFTSKDTGIDGVSYKDKGTRTYKDHKLVSTETTQVFMSDAGEVTIVTKEGSDGFSQTYTYESSQDNSKSVTKTITFRSGEEGDNQTNIITTEGFVNKNSQGNGKDPYGALMVATTKQGAIGAWQASSLPNSSDYAEIAATSDPLIMTKAQHKGKYDSVLLNYGRQISTTGLNPYEGEFDAQGKLIPGTENPNYNQMFATKIEIHSGYTDFSRGSHGCQTVKPGGVKPGEGDAKYGKGTSWQEFQKTMKLSSYNDGDFIGYYYLIK